MSVDLEIECRARTLHHALKSHQFVLEYLVARRRLLVLRLRLVCARCRRPSERTDSQAARELLKATTHTEHAKTDCINAMTCSTRDRDMADCINCEVLNQR